MISRSRPDALSSAAWRQIMQSAITVEDMEDVVEGIVSAAKGGNAAAQELIIKYTVGTPWKATRPTEALELPALEDFDSCVRALDAVLQAQAKGELSDEQARAYRDTISATAQVFRAEQGAADLDAALMEKGSTVVYARADEDPGDAYRRALEAGDREN